MAFTLPGLDSAFLYTLICFFASAFLSCLGKGPRYFIFFTLSCIIYFTSCLHYVTMVSASAVSGAYRKASMTIEYLYGVLTVLVPLTIATIANYWNAHRRWNALEDEECRRGDR